MAVSGPPEYAYQPPSAGMLRKPCSVRKRSISSSGLIPGSSRRKTLRMRASSKTTEVFDCSEETSRAAPSSRPSAEKSSAGVNSARPSEPWSVTPARIALTISRAIPASSARPSTGSPSASLETRSW